MGAPRSERDAAASGAPWAEQRRPRDARLRRPCGPDRAGGWRLVLVSVREGGSGPDGECSDSGTGHDEHSGGDCSDDDDRSDIPPERRGGASPGDDGLAIGAGHDGSADDPASDRPGGARRRAQPRLPGRGEERSGERRFQSSRAGLRGPASRRGPGSVQRATPGRLLRGDGGEGGPNVADKELFILPAKYKGRSCYRLCWGVYESEPMARSAVASVPDYFRKGGAAPKAVAAASILP